MSDFDPLEFAKHAQPGDRRVYGRGDHPPRDMVRAMRPLVEAGVLSPVSKREGAGYLFMVERARGEISAALARRRTSRGATRRRRVRKTSLSMVFDRLARAASRGEPCPTNGQLAAACGLSGKKAASYRLHKLAAMGRIAIDEGGSWPDFRRVITILVGRHAGAKTSEASL